MNPTNARTSSTLGGGATAELRPRNRRLISDFDDDGLDDNLLGSNRAASPRGTPFGSRPASPIPKQHPSRTPSTQPTSRFSTTPNGSVPERRGKGNQNSLFGSWGGSWTALQGLASNVLGSETSPSGSSRPRQRRPLEATHRRASNSAPPARWGTSSSAAAAASSVGRGSGDERAAQIRARKRQELLSNGVSITDSSGNYKRRSSDEMTGVEAEEVRNEEALVYVHRVKPNDTLAGISIRFHCPQSVVQKANRMWAHDTVQTRQVILVPVDACGVKGRPSTGPDEREEDDLLLGGDTPTEAFPTGTSSQPNGWPSSSSSTTNHKHDSSTSTTSHPAPPSSIASSHTAASSDVYKHDSWVLLPTDTTPTEIARLPRRKLGFFPPARRKSQCYSDTTTPLASPSLSLDLPRPGHGHTRTDSSHNAIFDNLLATTTPRLMRTTSIASTSTAAGQRNPYFLHGPGGVGTLDKTTRAPGPPPDRLNELFAHHLPDVNPPSGQSLTFLTPELFKDDSSSAEATGDDNPALTRQLSGNRRFGSASTSRTRGRSVGVSTPGGAGGVPNVEAWLRRMASRASTVLEGTATAASEAGKRRVGEGERIGSLGERVGDIDLIELVEDLPDANGASSAAAGGPGVDETSIPNTGATGAFGTARPDVPETVRARSTNTGSASGSGSGAGKSKDD
ncbi:carbohydrate-binding module family 50 protein [Aulographum hederae CBS 113979]|uniref:Carbohydrate-binding module family 50 protein n=1 Tax=Aulographum hederae CBS 113979 TaxID=1176131 RepID=A0A6G1GR64_9PEZI|nr:carbohydrate-binding module family 50 protein [Aulographum hederae CBS 113979]